MNGRDRRSEPEWPIRPNGGAERTSPTSSASGSRRGFSPVVIALGGLLLLLAIIWFFSSNRSPDQDKLTGAEAGSAAVVDSEKRCASKATYDLIKRELFRQAGQVRGSDQAAFNRLAAYATLRVENPVLESENDDSGAINCSASVALDLPPGVAVVGGRRSLAADVDYTLQASADGSGDVVMLRNIETIVTPLATLVRTEQQAPLPTPGQTDPLAPLPGTPAPGPGEPASPPAEPTPPAAPDAPQAARPSFNCGAARTRGEVAVCRDSGLAALDRQMAGQFASAMAGADPEERALLQRTRSRFLSYRDSCQSDGCIAEAYRGRMREIRDIMSGRWQPPR